MIFKSAFEKRCLYAGVPIQLRQLSFTSASVVILLTLTNIPGNILIVLVLVLDPNKNLRTPFNWLLVNLATADLIVGFITQPISAYYHIKERIKETHRMAYFITCTCQSYEFGSLSNIYRDYCMVGECAYERVSLISNLSQEVHNKNRTNEPTMQ